MLTLLHRPRYPNPSTHLSSTPARHVNVGLRWQEQAQAVLAIGRPGSGDAAPVEAGALQRMLAEGAGLGFLQAHLVELEAVLRDHQAWEGRVLALRDACGRFFFVFGGVGWGGRGVQSCIACWSTETKLGWGG